MVKRYFSYILLLFCIPLLCACHHSGFDTQTGNLGHRVDKLKETITEKKTETNINIIYLGRDYENNNFGPGKIKFVFEK